VRTLAEDSAHWAAGHPFEPLREIPGTPGLVLLLLGALAGLALSLRNFASKRPRLLDAARSPAGLVVLLAIAAPAAAAIASAIGDDVLMSRNLISSSPALALAAGWLTTRGEGRAAWLPAALVAGGLAVGAVTMLSASHQRADFQGAFAYIEDAGQPADPILEFPMGTPGPLSHMQAVLDQKGETARPLLRIGLPSYEDQLAASEPGGGGPYRAFDVPSPEELAQEAVDSAGPRLFAVVPGTDPFGYKPPPLAGVRDVLEKHFHVVETRRFPGVPTLTVYRFERP
jgi:hypothetical protein